MALKEGDKAPDFRLPFATLDKSRGATKAASNEKTVSLKDFKGKVLVLYFYPKDDTPGCTVEACGFRDAYKKIEKAGAVVVGVSPDSLKAHEKFIKKYSLPFLLLADEEKEISKAYKVWVKKSMYGREYMGVQRATFVISAAGKILKIYPKVTPKEHELEILDFLKSI